MTQANWQHLRGSAQSFLAASKFNFTIPNYVVAEQIAGLLNNNNRLARTHNSNSILTDKIQYFTELIGKNVVGCVGIEKQPQMDKLVHLSVSNLVRRQGIGKKLIKVVLDNSNKDTIYTQIRDDNLASLRLMESYGFQAIAYIPKINYNLLTMCLFRRIW